MVEGEELLACLICYGRAQVQDIVTRSRHIEDALRYLQMERSLEVARLISFVTKDLRSFERRKNSL